MNRVRKYEKLCYGKMLKKIAIITFLNVKKCYIFFLCVRRKYPSYDKIISLNLLIAVFLKNILQKHEKTLKNSLKIPIISLSLF